MRQLLILLLAAAAVAGDAFASPLTRADLDPAAFAMWNDGRETAIDAKRLREGPAWVVWTSDSEAGWSGIEYGESKLPGRRHLRFGFNRAVAVGTVIARGGDLSVLKPEAPYPGDLADDRQWLPAQRVEGSALTSAADTSVLATWVLPPGTTTRALRFSHEAKAPDRRYVGWVGGVWIMAARHANLAPQAVASASANGDTAARVNDQRDNGWDTWDNGDNGQERPVSEADPAWVQLSWPQPVTLDGLSVLACGAARIEAQVCTAPPGVHPAQAGADAWRTVAGPQACDPLYPKPIGPSTLVFAKPETTRGVRLRLTAPIDESRAHGHLHGKTKDGRRVWLTELLALSPLGDKPLAAPPAPPQAEAAHPPIPIRFHLDRPGLVTLVIEDAAGVRVRNLLAETRFPAGNNTAWWDGLDDRGRDHEAAEHHIYRIPGALVAPGTYRVRGLVRDDLTTSYEFSFYTNGKPAWETADGSGWWLANHSPPQAACFIPAGQTGDGQECMLLGSPVTEGGSGLAWVDLDGRKRYGIGWLGGIWTGAAYLARDAGTKPAPAWYAYGASAWDDELRLTGLKRAGGDGAVVKWRFPDKASAEIAGLAVRDGLVVVSLSKLGRLLFIDAQAGKALGETPCPRPRGLAFDERGRLLAIANDTVLRFALPADLPAVLAAGTALKAETVVAKGLDEAQGLCADAGQIYVSNHGRSHQVLVFAADGKPIRAIGKPGAPRTGPYDPLHMNYPVGMAVDSRGRLWVAEACHQPKRISVWKPDGSLDRQFFGPARYGEGGTIDARDKRRLFLMGMELGLDWESGTDVVKNVFWRPGSGLDFGGEWGPELALQVGGREYLTNVFNANPTNGPGVVGIWRYADGVAVPVAAAGRASDWPPIADSFGRLERFSVRWSGTVTPSVNGSITFHTLSDDGVRLWVGGKQLIDNWTGHGTTEDRGSIAVSAGKPLDLRLEWFQGGGGARIQLLWSGPDLPRAVVPADRLTAPGAAAAGGLRGDYYEGQDFGRLRFTRTDPVIDLDPPGGAIALPGSEPLAAAIRARLPAGVEYERDSGSLMFVWSDLDHDGKLSANEVSFRTDGVGAMTVQPDLSLATATALLVKTSGFDAQGVPLYDLTGATTLVPGGRGPNTSGGGHTLVCADGWTVLTIPPAPLPEQSSLCGARDGKVLWTYPNLWPGLHPSHNSPVPEFPGELIGTTRVVGQPFKPLGSDAGWCWAINGNKGTVYVFTSDGLFVATLFRDSRLASRWAMPAAVRGMRLDGTTLGEENFWPTMTQAADGQIYLVSGSCVTRVDGLGSIRRLPATELPITAAQLQQAQAWSLEQELARQRAAGGGTLAVALRTTAPVVDGELGDWAGAEWAIIDRRRNQDGDWGSRNALIDGAVAVAGDRLYAAWRTGDANLLRNAGTTWQTLFKTGGCLDLMVGADPAAAPDRRDPAPGDRRLLVTLVGGKPLAVLYTPVVPGHVGERVPFASPVATVLMDEVARVDDRIALAGKDGNYELSLPLALLGLKPVAGQAIRADIGLLRGNGFQTMQRCYWSNKATSMTADVPSEARLTPQLWGRWLFTGK